MRICSVPWICTDIYPQQKWMWRRHVTSAFTNNRRTNTCVRPERVGSSTSLPRSLLCRRSISSCGGMFSLSAPQVIVKAPQSGRGTLTRTRSEWQCSKQRRRTHVYVRRGRGRTHRAQLAATLSLNEAVRGGGRGLSSVNEFRRLQVQTLFHA